MLDLSARGRRTAPRRRGTRTGPPALDDAQVDALVTRMRSGETIAGMRRGAEAFANGSTVDLLRSAVVERRMVWIGFVDRHGVAGSGYWRRSAWGVGWSRVARTTAPCTASR